MQQVRGSYLHLKKHFLRLMSQLCQQEWSEWLRYKIQAQGLPFNILFLQRYLKIRFEGILRSWFVPYTTCSRLKTLKYNNWTRLRDEMKENAKKKQISHGNWRLDSCLVSQKIISLVDFTLTVYLHYAYRVRRRKTIM